MPKIQVNEGTLNSFQWNQIKIPPELCAAFWAWYDSNDAEGKPVKEKRLFRIGHIINVHVNDLHFLYIKLFGDHPK